MESVGKNENPKSHTVALGLFNRIKFKLLKEINSSGPGWRTDHYHFVYFQCVSCHVRTFISCETYAMLKLRFHNQLLKKLPISLMKYVWISYFFELHLWRRMVFGQHSRCKYEMFV